VTSTRTGSLASTVRRPAIVISGDSSAVAEVMTPSTFAAEVVVEVGSSEPRSPPPPPSSPEQATVVAASASARPRPAALVGAEIS